MLAAFVRRESLDGVTQLGTRNDALVLPKKTLQHNRISLSRFPQYPATGFANQIVVIP